MMHRCLIIVPAILIAAFSSCSGRRELARSDIRFLYVELRHSDSTLQFGAFAKNLRTRHCIFETASRAVTADLVQRWMGKAEGEVLFFFHCLSGGVPPFHKQCLKALENIARPDSGSLTVVSFIWHAPGIAYLRDWREAAGKGMLLGRTVALINEHYSGRSYMFAHSMGNRIMQGVLREMPESQRRTRRMVLFSPDLDVFASDADMVLCHSAAQRILLYMHRRDRLLLVSEIAHGRKRLGRSGFDTLMPRVSVTDMTELVRDVQNHTHLFKRRIQQRIRLDLKMGG